MPISSLTEVYGQYDNMTSSDYVNRIGCYATYGDQVAAWLPSNQQQQRVAMATDCRASSRLQYYDDRLVYCSTDQLDYQQQQQHWTHNKDNNCTSDRLSDKTDHRLTSYNMTSHHGGDVITMSGADSCELQQVDLSLSHLHHHHQQQQQQSRQSVYAERSSCCSPTDDHCTQQQQQQQHTQCLPSRYCSQLSYHTNSCSNSPTDCTSTGVNNLAYQSLTPGTALPVVPVGLPVPAVCRIPCDTTTSHLAPHIPVMTSPGRLPISSGNTSEATSSWLRLNDVTSNMAVDDVISDVNSNYLQYQSMTSHTPAAVAAMNIGRPSVIKELQLDTTCAADDDVTRCVIGAGMTSRRRQKPRQQRRRNVSSGAKRTSATGAGSEMENTRTGITVGDGVERVEQLSDMESIDIPPEFVNDAERRQWEREKIKKEKHNRIERRRRFNINDHIKILGSLLPNHEFTGHKFQQNKGNILKASVAYIRLLQQDQARLVTVEHRTHQLDTVNRQIITRLKELEGLLRTQGCNNNNNNISCSDYTLLPTDSCNSVNSTVVAAAVKEEPSSSSTVDHRMTSPPPQTTTIRLTV